METGAEHSDAREGSSELRCPRAGPSKLSFATAPSRAAGGYESPGPAYTGPDLARVGKSLKAELCVGERLARARPSTAKSCRPAEAEEMTRI
jgi:hypothetical protein